MNSEIKKLENEFDLNFYISMNNDVAIKFNYDYDLICSLPIGMIEAIKHEQYILDKYKSYQYQPDEYFAGWTECLSVNPLELDVTLAELAKQYDFNSY